MNTNAQPKDELSDEIKLLKAKHGFLKQIHIKKLEKTLIFKKPDRIILSAAMKLRHEDPMESNRVYALNCLVHGDASLLDDGEILLSVSPHLEDLVDLYDVEVKNL